MRDDLYLKDLSQNSHWMTRFSWWILLCSLHRCFTLNVLLHSVHSNETSWWTPSLWFFNPLCERKVFPQSGSSHTYLKPSWTVAWCCTSLLWLEFVKLLSIRILHKCLYNKNRYLFCCDAIIITLTAVICETENTELPTAQLRLHIQYNWVHWVQIWLHLPTVFLVISRIYSGPKLRMWYSALRTCA